jgi:hypothetical protein
VKFDTWEVRLRNVFFGQLSAEVGIIDYDEINADIAQSEKKCVHKHPFGPGDQNISFNLDMEKRILNVKIISGLNGPSTNSYQFTARRVSPFFSACSARGPSISLME